MKTADVRLRIITAALACLPVGLSAQVINTQFTKGTRIASVGLMAGGDYDGAGIGGTFEVGVYSFTSKVHLGIGGFTGVQRNTESIGAFQSKSSVIPLMALANVHFPIASQPKLDVYAGGSIGLIRSSIDVSGTVGALGPVDASETNSGLGLQAGIRLALASKLSLMGQLGVGDLPLIFAGATIKF